MSDDLREVFATLEDPTSGEGEALAPLQSGESPTGKNGSIGFSYRDSSGNVVLPQLNSEGAVPVSLDPGTTTRNQGKILASTQVVDSRSLIAEDAITLAATYTKFSANVSCRRDCLFEMVYVDDDGGVPVETELLSCIVSPGQYSFNMSLLVDILSTAGGTGTQKIKLYGTPLQQKSNMRGQYSFNKVAV